MLTRLQTFAVLALVVVAGLLNLPAAIRAEQPATGDRETIPPPKVTRELDKAGENESAEADDDAHNECKEPPSDVQILKACSRGRPSIPFCYGMISDCQETRDDIEITKERIVDQVDPPRFFPLVGEARLHHCHWKCTVRYLQTIESSFPIPFRTTRPRVEVIYIDKDHLHYPEVAPLDWGDASLDSGKESKAQPSSGSAVPGATDSSTAGGKRRTGW